jgi:hypothetical protein
VTRTRRAVSALILAAAVAAPVAAPVAGQPPAQAAKRHHRPFCSTHRCIPNFSHGHGSIVQCRDGMWSHSGGRPGACSHHGGPRGKVSVSAARSCGFIRVGGDRFKVTIQQGPVSCPRARNVMRALFAGRGKLHGPENGPASRQYWTLHGWRCGFGAGAGECTRHGRSIGASWVGHAASAQAALDARGYRRCPNDPGGAYDNVRTRRVSCRRAEAILHHNGHGYGFHCRLVQHGPHGVGFPADRDCRRGAKRVIGDIFDGQSTS